MAAKKRVKPEAVPASMIPAPPDIEPVAFLSPRKFNPFRVLGWFALGTLSGGASWALLGESILKGFAN